MTVSRDAPAVVVIGGGIAGASAAYRLSRLGARITLVDREDPGRATSAGAGIVAPATSKITSPPWFEMAAAATAFYPELVAQLADDGQTETGYEVVGSLFVATDDDEAARLPELRRTVESRARAGVGNVGDLALLEPDDARALFPALAPGTSGLHLSGGARVDGRLISSAMRAAATRHGASVVGASVALRVRGARVDAVQFGWTEIACDAVVLCPGAWTSRLLRAVGVELPIAPQRGQIVHLDLPETPTSRWPSVVGFGSHYLLAFPEHRVVAGATREDGVGFDVRLTAAGTRESSSRRSGSHRVSRRRASRNGGSDSAR